MATEQRLITLYEDFFDDWAPEQTSNTAQRAAANDDVVYIPGDPDDFKYFMEIRLNVDSAWKQKYKNKLEAFDFDFGAMYEELVYVCRSTMIDGDFYITPMYFWDENKSKDDYQNYLYRIPPIQFKFPYPKKFSLKDVYGAEFTSSLNSPYFKFRIYFDAICYYPYKTFISRWRMMMQMIRRVFVTGNNGITEGEIVDLQEVGKGRNYYVSNMYLSGYNHHQNEFKKLYRLFFGEEAPDYNGDSIGGRKSDATDRMFRRLHLAEIAKATEKYNGEFGISVEYCQSNFVNKGEYHSTAWVSFLVHTTDDKLDMVDVENFLTKNFFLHIPKRFYHFIKFAVFLKSDFTGPNIINSYEQDRKERGWRRSSWDSNEINKFEPYAAQAARIEFRLTGSSKTNKEERFRVYYFSDMGSSSKFYIYYGDKNGKIGRTPMSDKYWTGYSYAEDFSYVYKMLDDNVDLWQKQD